MKPRGWSGLLRQYVLPLVLAAGCLGGPGHAQSQGQEDDPDVSKPAVGNTSPPLREIPPAPEKPGRRIIPIHLDPNRVKPPKRIRPRPRPSPEARTRLAGKR